MGGAGKCDAGCEVGGSWTSGIHPELQQEEPRCSAGTLMPQEEIAPVILIKKDNSTMHEIK